MTKGWEYLEPLETARPSEELDAETVVAACDKLNELNCSLRCRIESALRDKGFNKWADGLRNEFSASDKRLFNCYFSNKAYSFDIPSHPPDHLDGCRAAVIFHMSDALQQTLICHLRALPEATVENSDSSTDPDEFTRVYRFTNMRSFVSAIKSVQIDVENFAFGAEDLLLGTDGSRCSLRSTEWPYDAETMDEQILLGFKRTSSPSMLNSKYQSSPIVAAGLVRSHLEAVLFRKDFHSSFSHLSASAMSHLEAVLSDTASTTSSTGQEPLSVDRWEAALKYHRDAGHVTSELNHWVKELYRLLSRALHSGVMLSRGEIWAFRRVVKRLRNSLNPNSPATAPTRSSRR